MSLLGIRDISNLSTPPPGRMPISTCVIRFDRKRIREAILSEMERDGQVYFVHNRIEDIGRMAEVLRETVPEARVEVVHGQMKKNEIREIMSAFVAGGTDVLVTTTIIESGVDIPNVNTLFVNHAQNFGLAQLHQLRGRVGRFSHRAHAYLIIPSKMPLPETAERRVRAIEEYTELGAGFRIALRDLEIRGAGNILGDEQSGHIAAVGYDMYCRLLSAARDALSGSAAGPLAPQAALDLPVAALIPPEYVEDLKQRLDLYRRISAARDERALSRVAASARDRFGPLPPEVELLFDLQRLKRAAASAGILSLTRARGGVRAYFEDQEAADRFAERSGGRARWTAPNWLMIDVPDDCATGQDLVDSLAKVVRGSVDSAAQRPP